MIRRRVVVFGQGSVEAVFEGDAGSVDALVGWARRGPTAAAVSRVDVYPEDPQGLTGFEIRPTPH